MPRHGRVWRWSTWELQNAVEILRDFPEDTFGAADVAVVARALSGQARHGVGLMAALRREGRIVAVDRSNPRQYRYQLRGPDGQQAQRPTPHPD